MVPISRIPVTPFARNSGNAHSCAVERVRMHVPQARDEVFPAAVEPLGAGRNRRAARLPDRGDTVGGDDDGAIREEGGG